MRDLPGGLSCLCRVGGGDGFAGRAWVADAVRAGWRRDDSGMGLALRYVSRLYGMHASVSVRRRVRQAARSDAGANRETLQAVCRRNVVPARAVRRAARPDGAADDALADGPVSAIRRA